MTKIDKTTKGPGQYVQPRIPSVSLSTKYSFFGGHARHTEDHILVSGGGGGASYQNLV
jgi:hypothetical protein